ncbi:MAG: amidohydrolase family protein, partial [Rhodospirillaceae bacterium]|nr:amidohydrolase family protein [Rhodospirillaceae bacterium]
MPAVLIRNGRIVTAVDDYQADILIQDGRIHTIGRNIEAGPDVETHDARGLLVLPGGVDVHTHLDWEFGTARTVDTFGTGTMAAAFGGTTTVVDFANQTRGQSPLKGLEDWHARAASACVDVAAHMILLDVDDRALADMKPLIEREGVTSFKLFMAYPGVLMVDDGAIFKTMRIAGANGAMICMHAENGAVIQVLVEEAVAAGHKAPRYHALTRPTLLEGEATHRAIRLAELAGAPLYIVHLSAAEALRAVSEARDLGLPVHAETCPHYLFLTDREYDRPDFEGAK